MNLVWQIPLAVLIMVVGWQMHKARQDKEINDYNKMMEKRGPRRKPPQGTSYPYV